MSTAAESPSTAAGRRAPRRVFRQRAAVGSFVVGALVIGFIVLGGAFRGHVDLADVLWGALVLAVLWTLFMRPAVVLDAVGVTFRNVAADLHIPWGAVGGTEQRWNLVVWTEPDGDAYTAWAIGSRPERSHGIGGGFDPSRLVPGHDRSVAGQGSTAGGASGRPSPAERTKATSGDVGRLIMRTKADFDRAVSAGLLPAGERTVRRSWAWDALVPLAVSALAVAVYHLVR